VSLLFPPPLVIQEVKVSDRPFAPSSLMSESSLQLVQTVPASSLHQGLKQTEAIGKKNLLLSDFVAAVQLLPNIYQWVKKKG